MSTAGGRGEGRPERGRRSGGRPRSPETGQSMLGAAADLLREEGLQGFSISAVATRTGSSRTTVYRRWPARDGLLLDALAEVFPGDPLPQDGNLLANLIAIGRDRRDVMRDALFVAALPLLVELSLGRSHLASAAQDRFRSPFDDAFVRGWGRLAGRHEVRSDTAPELLLSMLLGTILYRILLGQSIEDADIDQLCALIVAGVQPTELAG
jgi:AcrR family transcriptional regulator